MDLIAFSLYRSRARCRIASGQAAAGSYAADITISVCYVGDPSC